MKAVALAALGTFLLADAASAACTLNALAGEWRIGSEDGYCIAKVSKTGKLSGECGGGTISITKDCKVTGRIGGQTFEGRTDAIPTKSSLKPNQIIGYGPALGGVAGYRR